MFKPLLTRLLNHIISQNSWAKEQLQPHAGKSVEFIIMPVSAMVTILEDGGLALAGEAATADASISMSPSVALRLLNSDEAANTLVALAGDIELAATIAKVMRGVRWEYEEDLSRLIGDIPSHQITAFGRKAVSELRHQTQNAVEMLSEYWQEEQPLIAKKRHVTQFSGDVDRLRDDAERLAKRIAKLERLADASDSAATEPLSEKPAA
jgi:ubiquinone biosynthesis protein UbiJ